MINAVLYFGMVFAAGFILGVLRTLLLVPVIGVRYAELMEMPIMIGVVYFAARYIRRRSEREGKLRLFLVGVLALVILLVFELALVLWARGMSLTDYVQSRDPVSGAAYVCALLMFMGMPWFLSVLTENREPDDKNSDC